MNAPAPPSQAPAPPVVGFNPATFVERGVALPFTTPRLEGARVRQSAWSKLEVVITNPSNGRGVYIIPWTGIETFANVTLHDRRLVAEMTTSLAATSDADRLVRGITPARVNAVARSVVSAGYAGQAAADAADAAELADRRAATQTMLDLLLEILRQGGPGSVTSASGETLGEAELRARHALTRLSPSLGTTPEALSNILTELATLYAGIGVGVHSAGGRVPRAIAAMEALQASLRSWARQRPDEAGAEAGYVCSLADMTLACIRNVQQQALALTRDMPALLSTWMRQPGALSSLVSRPDWVLDGWPRLCQMWNTAEATLGREMTLLEISATVPCVPAEAAEWTRAKLPVQPEIRWRRKLELLESWRSGITTPDIVARNEMLLALVA